MSENVTQTHAGGDAVIIDAPFFFLSVRYGQMTAGSYCYIGPQGIVHGTMVREYVGEKIRSRCWCFIESSNTLGRNLSVIKFQWLVPLNHLRLDVEHLDVGIVPCFGICCLDGKINSVDVLRVS